MYAVQNQPLQAAANAAYYQPVQAQNVFTADLESAQEYVGWATFVHHGKLYTYPMQWNVLDLSPDDPSGRRKKSLDGRCKSWKVSDKTLKLMKANPATPKDALLLIPDQIDRAMLTPSDPKRYYEDGETVVSYHDVVATVRHRTSGYVYHDNVTFQLAVRELSAYVKDANGQTKIEKNYSLTLEQKNSVLPGSLACQL